ncbi:hypothetical protein AVEN_148150-1 [Araneus ventricosus]|uniref:Uncharacterized protein n=1 Tax=Araneus ventricosus TaxID=182803 RepID=A0A4Y2K974_ARAVE|nr:hypothetical protein AVEN_148150-1 [Araneus ventricosus]
MSWVVLRGRSEDKVVSDAVEEIYSYLEGKDGYQYSPDELMEQISGEKLTSVTFRQKMMGKYGDLIVFSTVCTRKTVLCFSVASEKFLRDTWYTSKSSDEKAEREGSFRTSGLILLKEVQIMPYGTTIFPTSDNFCSKGKVVVPQTLRALMDSLSGTEKDDEKGENEIDNYCA